MRTTRVSRVGSLLLAVMVALGLAACGGGGSKADAGANFVGVWELSSVEGDSEIDDSDITMMKELGMLFLLSLEEDGTGVFDFGGEVEPLTWKATAADKATLDSGDLSGHMTLEGKTLKVTDGDETLVFTPSTETPTEVREDEEEAEAAEEEAEEAEEAEESVVVDLADGVVILDNEYVTVTVLGVGVDWADDVGYQLHIANNWDKTLDVSTGWDSFSVNGKMVDATLYQTLKPGTYAEVFLYFQSADVGGSDVNNLKNVVGTIEVQEEDSFDVLSETEVDFPDATDLTVVDIR